MSTPALADEKGAPRGAPFSLPGGRRLTEVGKSCTDGIRAKTKDRTVPATVKPRDDRIELRATKEEKRLLAAAASYERLDVTSFVMRSALPEARKVVDRAERIVLSARDTVRVLKLLENPPGPSAALKAAAKRRAMRK